MRRTVHKPEQPMTRTPPRHLPLGGKHRQLLRLIRKHAEPEEAEAEAADEEASAGGGGAVEAC